MWALFTQMGGVGQNHKQKLQVYIYQTINHLIISAFMTMNVVIQFKVPKAQYYCQQTRPCTNIIFEASRQGAVKPLSKALYTLGDNVDWTRF